MIHLCQDDGPPIGRPPIVRDKVLACLRELGRARVARVSEETGVCSRTVYYVLNRAFQQGEATRYLAEGCGKSFYVYEWRGA